MLPIGAQSKLVLVALADNANDEGYCYPSQSALARKASLSERAVRDHLHSLESSGWFAVLRRGNGRGKATEYQLNTGRIKGESRAAYQAEKGSDVSRLSDRKGGRSRHEKAADCADKGGSTGQKRRKVSSDQPSLVQPSLEPSGEPSSGAALVLQAAPTASRSAKSPRSGRQTDPDEPSPIPRTKVTLTFIEELRAKYGRALRDFDASVNKCRDSNAFRFARDKQTRLEQWLKDDIAKETSYAHHGNPNGRRQGPAAEITGLAAYD